MQSSFNKPLTGLACALTLALSPFATADLGRTQLSTNHLSKPNSPKYQAVGQCVRAIQKHWDSNAKLVLDKRATLRETDGQQLLLVDGWVWQQGQRVQKTHQCATQNTSKQVALTIVDAAPDLLASQ